eukprot:CAMPEP_0172190678 /NCGR_PEP_ID=MMETSP1050-20130122/23253_1 /TAXON_ID=233186 /ORGANISM="Cryptomonas curvata, Strain CCAP979/52" /LENGTH=220 /DNA_ID=CAMNT_0012865591 /DNA_START=138 /DNA_END=797 /DNA_ORIENTATION=+
MVLSVENPHYILATESGLEEILEHSTNDLRCQTIQIFLGPGTDDVLFRSSIERTTEGTCSKYQLMLYDRFGACHKKMVHFSPYRDRPGTNQTCMVSIHRSDALLLQDALADSHLGQALISAEWPFHFRRVNDPFAATFECSPFDVAGQPLSILHSQTTDLPRWCALLDAAAQGQAARGRFHLASLQQTQLRAALSFFPVVDSPNGPIAHILLRLEPEHTP